MTVSREDAIYAYRMILGREPESEAVIEATMGVDSLAQLRQVFFNSGEFRTKNSTVFGGGVPVGRFFGEPRADIDIDCTPEQLKQMFDRIASAWQAFGETEPHWSVLTQDEYRQDNLAASIDLFYRSGRRDVDAFFNFLRRAAIPTSFAKALDFGCGVGRLTLGLAQFAEQVVGVDISPPHLRLAAERAREEGIDNVAFEAIGSVDELNRYRGFDLVLSLIVLQHNPPPVMAALYARLLAALAPNGVAIVQIPTFIKDQTFSSAEYLASEQPQMEMNFLPQAVIYRLIDEADCRVIEVREDATTGDAALSHTFVVQKRKARSVPG